MQVGNGKISVGTVTVTVTGTNDVPEVSEPVVRGGAEGAGAFTVNLLDHASDVDHGAVLHVADVVWTDPHTSSGLPPGFSMGANGTLIVDANDPAYNSLAVDEAKTWTLSYDVVDEHGASVRQTAAITITGANDRPEVRAPVIGGGREGAGAFRVNLLDHASDVDHGAVLHVADVVWTDPHTGSGLPAGFTINADGTLAVDANDGAYNSLAEGQTKTFNFAYDVVDEHGASVRPTAAVMITGTNDAPEVVVNSPATVNEGDAGVSAPITVIISDHVTISDPDLADARLPYAGGLAFVSATGPAPSGGVAALFTLDPATGTISYDRAAFNYLATGESITATFAFDSSSGPDVLPQQITLTIKGETDAAPLPLGAMRYFGRFAGLTNDAGGEWLELSGFTFGFDPVIHTLPDGQTVVSRFLPRPVLLELGSGPHYGGS